MDQIKDFTLCHDNDRFPAKHRIYQTATPKIYTQKALREKQKEDWVVRNMDDQSVFGPGPVPAELPGRGGEQMAVGLPHHRGGNQRGGIPTKSPTRWPAPPRARGAIP